MKKTEDARQCDLGKLQSDFGVEEAHMLEFQQLNIVWDKKMQEYEQQQRGWRRK